MPLKLSWGREKHDLAERWPKNSDGTPEKPVLLVETTEEDNAAAMTIELLRTYGIPAMRQYAENGALDKVLFGTPSCGVGLYVPESMLEDARALLAPVDEAALEEAMEEESKGTAAEALTQGETNPCNSL